MLLEINKEGGSSQITGSLGNTLFKISYWNSQDSSILCLKGLVDCVTDPAYNRRISGKEHCDRKLHIFYALYCYEIFRENQLPLFS